MSQPHYLLGIALPAPEIFPENNSNLCGTLFGLGLESLASIASPKYPEHYPSKQDCVRVIQASPGYDIVVKFNHFFQIEDAYGSNPAQDQPCPNDYIEFRDGRYGFSTLIGKFCGNVLPAVEIRAVSGYMWLRFHSDDYLEYKGFHATHEMVRSLAPAYSQGANECHFEVHNALDGWIDSKAIQHVRPNPGPVECVWRIESPPHLQLSLSFDQFELARPNNCEDRFVEIMRSHGVRDIYTGGHVLFLRLRLSSGKLVAQTKIRALYSSFINDKNCSLIDMLSCGDGKCIPKELACNGNRNCPYASDETLCTGSTRSALKLFIYSGYSPLILLIILVFITVVALYVWSFHAHTFCEPFGEKLEAPTPVENGHLKPEHAVLQHY
ncbi:unnamed protein product, partial [Mesorhabditis spiculigera]